MSGSIKTIGFVLNKCHVHNKNANVKSCTKLERININAWKNRKNLKIISYLLPTSKLSQVFAGKVTHYTYVYNLTNVRLNMLF